MATRILCATLWAQTPQGISHNKEQPAVSKSSIMGQPDSEGFNRQPLEQLLNPDGTLNLSSDFSGSLDPSGFRMITGPDGGHRRLTDKTNQYVVCFYYAV